MSTFLRILLIRCQTVLYIGDPMDGGVERPLPAPGEPLGLLLIGAQVSGEHDVELFDMDVEQDLQKKLTCFRPNVVGVTCASTAAIPETLEVFDTVKKWDRDTFTIVGGPGAMSHPMVFNTDDVDVVVLGEGEKTFKELIGAVAEKEDYSKIGGIAYRKSEELIFNEPQPLIENLNDLALPDRELCKNYFNDYVYFFYPDPVQRIYTSRGCKYRCTFCCTPKWMGGYVRYQSPERVVEEIRNTSAPIIDIVDEDFFSDPDRAERIVELIREKKIKKELYIFVTTPKAVVKNRSLLEKWCSASDIWVGMGLESADDTCLRKIGKSSTIQENNEALKILEELGISCGCSFMVLPEFERDDFLRLKEYVMESSVTFARFLVLTPFPGSQLYEKLSHKITTRNWKLFDTFHPVLPTRLPKEEFIELYKSLLRLSRERMTQYLINRDIEQINLDLIVDLSETFAE